MLHQPTAARFSSSSSSSSSSSTPPPANESSRRSGCPPLTPPADTAATNADDDDAAASAADVMPSSSSSSSVAPTYTGHISSTFDALILIEACLQGRLNHVSRPPRERERANLIASGNVFIYEEHSSGIRRWSDGISWTAPKAVGNFLMYRQQTRGSGSNGDARGLYKRTITVTVRGVSHHLIAYFGLQDVLDDILPIPCMDPELYDVGPRDELLNQGFLAPLDEDDLGRYLEGKEF